MHFSLRSHAHRPSIERASIDQRNKSASTRPHIPRAQMRWGGGQNLAELLARIVTRWLGTPNPRRNLSYSKRFGDFGDRNGGNRVAVGAVKAV